MQQTPQAPHRCLILRLPEWTRGPQPGGREQVPPTWPGRAHYVTTHGSKGMALIREPQKEAGVPVPLRALPGFAAAALPAGHPLRSTPAQPRTGRGLLCWGSRPISPEAGGAVMAKLAELWEDPQPADSSLPALPSDGDVPAG